jgi:hypothetical protein
LLLLRRIGGGQSYFVHESIDETKENSVLHPFVPILVKTSIADKALYLLRVLSSLMSHGALHPFVPSMLENLRIFFDFAFPMAFSEIEGIIQSIIKCINSSSKFPSLVMSLLSNVMRLLNDRQFRISLCAVLHEVESNIHPRHTQNCLDVFGTMVPFLPADVAAANLQKLFTILPLDNQTLSDAFAELLGSLAHQHSALVLPFVKNWTVMKSNASFLVGKSRQPISYSFITKVLLVVVKELPTDILVKTDELFGLLVILTKRTDVHPIVLLSAMNELCSRLSFHRSTFELGSSTTSSSIC